MDAEHPAGRPVQTQLRGARRKSGDLGVRGGGENSSLQGKVPIFQPQTPAPAEPGGAANAPLSALHLHNRRDVAETNYRPSDGGGLGCKCGGPGGDYFGVFFFKKFFEVIVWVKLQRGTNQCGARTDSEAPSANHSGRMPKLLLHFPPPIKKGERGEEKRED